MSGNKNVWRCADCEGVFEQSDSTNERCIVCKECLRKYRREMGMVVVEENYYTNYKPTD